MKKNKVKRSGDFERDQLGPFGTAFFAIVRDLGDDEFAVGCGIKGEDAISDDPHKRAVVRQQFYRFKEEIEAEVFG